MHWSTAIQVMASRTRAWREGRRPGVRIARGVRFGQGVRCAANGGQIIIGSGVEIGARTGLRAAPRATLVIEEEVFIAGDCILAANGHVTIGRETMIAELVSIRDHDHDPTHPPRSGHTLQSDVRIGKRVWVGAKATVGRGVTIGDDAVVGAHALVNRSVPAAALAAGVPARVVRERIR